MTTDPTIIDTAGGARGGLRRTRRRRRPSGAPPPLPRSIGATGKVWLVAGAVVLLWLAILLNAHWARRLTDQVDAALLRQVARLRTEWLTRIMSGISRVGWGWAVTLIAVALIAGLMVLKRWRHLFTFLGSFAALEFVGTILYNHFRRPRPYDVTIIGRWAGFSIPAPPVALVTLLAVVVIYALVVPGRPRSVAKAVAAIGVAAFVASQLYLATFSPFDVLIGVVLPIAIAVNAFRVFTPNEVFPVAYRRGKTAHLDVSGRRANALRQGVRDQLGLTVLDIQPIGLAGSGGSTPLRLCIAGDPDTYLFAKLYAMSHVRADRWYKLGRTVLYGRLEDEAPFQSVRRLVEYEDYAARLLCDIGIPTAASYGIVEITPEREYLLVTEFFDGAQEIGEADVDEGVIDEALLLVRRLWDAGLAHRDIKPANLLVHDGRVKLIDVFFMQVRPSPWRQAVDLANMMLVLAVRTDAERVYQRAVQYFSPNEIAEGFAAVRGIASPTQLRMAVKRDGRDLVRQFRALAPERRPISLQRWSVKRLALAAAIILAAVVLYTPTVSLLKPAYNIDPNGTPSCGTSSLMILIAQSVPAATSVPCIASLPAGWRLGGLHVVHGRAEFWLDSERGGKHAVEVNLVPARACDLTGATEVASDEVGTRRFEHPNRLPPRLESTRFYTFPGGCVTYRYAFTGPASASLLFDADTALAFEARAVLVAKVRVSSGLRLCGAGAPCRTGS